MRMRPRAKGKREGMARVVPMPALMVTAMGQVVVMDLVVMVVMVVKVERRPRLKSPFYLRKTAIATAAAAMKITAMKVVVMKDSRVRTL